MNRKKHFCLHSASVLVYITHKRKLKNHYRPNGLLYTAHCYENMELYLILMLSELTEFFTERSAYRPGF